MTLSGRLASYVVVGAIAAALLVYVFDQLDGLFGGDRDARISAASIAQLRQHPALQRFRAKVRQVENRRLAEAAAWGDTALRLRALADSADSSAARLARAAGLPAPEPSPWRDVAAAEGHKAAACSLAYKSCEQRAMSAEAEADSLARRLEDQLKVKPHRCWLSVGAGVGRGGWGAQAGAYCGLVRIPLLP